MTDEKKLIVDFRNAKGIIVLDAVRIAAKPDYCVHGEAPCFGTCGGNVWLGSNSYEIAARGEAVPFCRECAARIIPGSRMPTLNVNDHLRADGPHE